MNKSLWTVGALLALACSSGTESSPVSSLDVTPNPVVLQRGDSLVLTVNALDSQGHLILGVAIAFHSANQAIATVSPVGMVHGVQKGSTTITVSAGTTAKQVPVSVQVPVAGVRVTPSAVAIRAHGTQRFTAAVVDIDGDPITPQPTFQYFSADTTLITINSTGLAQSVGPAGSTTISAQSTAGNGSAAITVLDSSVLARLYLSGSPAFIAGFQNTAYVSRPFSNKVEILNLSTTAFVDSIAVGSLPCGVVFNGSGTLAYVANQSSDNVSIINTATHTQSGLIPVHGDPLPVAMPAGDSVLFVTTNANKLFKINLRNNSVVDSLPLPATSHHMWVHPNDTLLYVATRDGGTVIELNWRTMTTVRTFTLGVQTLGMEMSPDRSELYVTTASVDSLYTITLSNGAITSAPVLAGASTIGLSADGTELYVGELFAGQIEVLNRATRAHIKTIVTGGTVREMVTDVPRNRLVVTNEGGWVDIVR